MKSIKMKKDWMNRKSHPQGKSQKKVDLNVRFDVQDKSDDSMEETEIEGKEAKEARTQDQILSMNRRIFDQNQRLFMLQQEKDKLEAENQTLRDKSNTDVRELISKTNQMILWKKQRLKEKKPKK